MNPLADLRAAVLKLNHVPAGTPVDLNVGYGQAPSLVYDERNGAVRLTVGGGQPQGRPTMGQLRAWLGLPPAGGGLAGFWASATGTEPWTWRGALTLASAVASGVHGARRNGGSVMWGAWWFLAGAVLPVLTPALALGQGYGDCANNCRRQPTERR